MINWIQRKRNKKGFTLIELIVVIAILGILAAIAIPRLMGFQEKAKVSSDKATFATINSAIAIGVANGDIKPGANATTANTITVTTAATTGVVSVGYTTAPAAPYVLLESGAEFKLTDNIGKSWTWKIDNNGVISAAPVISDAGVVTQTAP